MKVISVCAFAVGLAVGILAVKPGLANVSGPVSHGSEKAEGHGFSALIFSKTAGFRHDSIPAGIAAIEALGAEHDFDVTSTEGCVRVQ